MKELHILHLSDLHCQDRELAEFRIRRDALIRDLRGLQVKPDLVVVSGDVAFSGSTADYEIAKAEFFSPLLEEVGLSADKVVFCPGNHDVDRALIDPLVKEGISSRLTNTDTAQELMGNEKWILPQQSNYLSFLESICGERPSLPFFNRVLLQDRLKIGIAVLDSSWLCLDDNTESRIFLTRRQVQQAIEETRGCDLKIAVFHHPLSWFHPSEQDIVQQDLKAAFDLLLVGHKHEVESAASKTPSTDSLCLMASSFFDGHPEGAPDGYSLYTVYPDERQIRARFRMFVRSRSSFDQNVFHAREGQFDYPLPSTAFVNIISQSLARRITETTGELDASMREGLRRAQDLEDPIVLLPVVDAIEWRDGNEAATRLPDPFAAAAETNCVVYGPPDVGTTTFLQELCTQINGDPGRLAVYLTGKDLGTAKSRDQLLKRMVKVANLSEDDFKSARVSLVVDELPGVDASLVRELLLCAEHVDQVVVCIKNTVLFDSLASSVQADDLAYVRLRYWGPSRLRQFTNRYIEATNIPMDPDVAYKFIADSLSLSDLPVTPLLVALYLRVFFELGGQLTGLSFVRLLEKLEEKSLDAGEVSSSYSIYNLRLMLRQLAAACHEAGSLGVPREEYEGMVDRYFSERALPVDAPTFIRMLEQSGILIEAEGLVSFSCIVFFHYYLAQALDEQEVDLAEHLRNLHTALQLGDALAYYAGRNREEESLARELLRCLEEEYEPAGEVTAPALEEYIQHLLAGDATADNKDEVAQEAVEARWDYDREDEQFEEDQRGYRSVAQALLNASPPQDKVEKVAWNIMALKTFYNVFRNLENIKAEPKKQLLNRILDFHLACNMDLIDLFAEVMDDEHFRSLCAYLVTIGGEAFLSKNVGSVSLQQTIEDLLNETDNELKAFLLHCIYADLHLPNYASRLESFIVETDSLPLIEMGYVKVYELLVRYEGDTIQTALISAFNAAFDQRQKKYGKIPPISLQRLRDKALNEAKTKHMVARQNQISK